MKPDKLLFAGAALLFVGAALLVFFGPDLREQFSGKDSTSTQSTRTDLQSGGDEDPTASLPKPAPPPFDISTLPPSPMNAMLEPDINRADRLRIVGGMFLDYYSVFRALPTGTQEEIYTQFTGQNARNIEYYRTDHPAVNGDGVPLNGEGNSIFIHIISATGGIFELRDPGPDAAPFTEDDLVLRHPRLEEGAPLDTL